MGRLADLSGVNSQTDKLDVYMEILAGSFGTCFVGGPESTTNTMGMALQEQLIESRRRISRFGRRGFRSLQTIHLLDTGEKERIASHR
jgi:hypothetical protein